MTKEELEQEAEEWLNKWEFCNKCENKVDCISNFTYCKKVVLQSYLASAEPREKRIAELEKENAELKSLKDVADLIRLNNSSVVAMAQLNNNNVALRKENAELKARVSEQSERINELTQELDDKINRFG